MEGIVDFTADLAATGNSLTAMKRSLSGGLSLNGENLMVYGIDIDALIPKLERTQNFSLVDVGAFLVAGPFGSALTKGYSLGSAYIESRGGKGAVRKFVSIWKVKGGVADAADVALATKKYRLAMKGGLDFNNGRFADVTIAVLTKKGCAAYSQKISGPFGRPSVGKTTIINSLTGPATNALESAWDLIWSCKVIYKGSVAQPGN